MTRISSGVISEPPPMPVIPTSMPTPKPKRMIAGSIASGGQVQAALDLVGARPASVPAPAGDRAVRAADRVVAAVVQRVVGHVVIGDVAPDVLLGPVGERRALDLARMALVGPELRSRRARRGLLPPQPRDPGVDLAQRAL